METFLILLPNIFSYIAGILIAFGISTCCTYTKILRLAKTQRQTIRKSDIISLIAVCGGTIFWTGSLFIFPQWSATVMDVLLIAELWFGGFLFYISKSANLCALSMTHNNIKQHPSNHNAQVVFKR